MVCKFEELVHLYCFQNRPKKVISETYVNGKPSSLLGPFLSKKREVGMYKQCRINSDRLYAHANEFCCLTLRSLLLRVGGGWHLAVGPLGRKTLLDVYLEAEARTLVCVLVEGLRVWGKRAVPLPPPTMTVTWDLPCSWGKYRKPYHV
jgi:hypothetical protein